MCSNVFKLSQYLFKCVQTCSKPIQICSNLFKLVQNLFKCVQMCSNLFKTCSNVFKWVQTCSKLAQMSSNVFKWVQNLFKCVKCVPACPKLVQMCSKLFKNYLPFQCKGSDMTSRAWSSFNHSLNSYYFMTLCENFVWKDVLVVIRVWPWIDE